MSRIKRIWAALKPDPKHELSLIYVYTFKTGERLYTYKPEDYGRVSARYNRNIQEAANYLKNFMLTEHEWKSAITTLKENGRKVLRGEMDATDHILDCNSTFDWFLHKVDGLKSADETILELMFCMFYVLEDEKAAGYDKAYNEKKISLLNSEPEKRDFFLDSLKRNTKNLLPISKEDTLMLFQEMMQMKGVLTFMNMQDYSTD